VGNANLEDIRAAYRIFLRREPENEEVMKELLQSDVDAHHLIRIFMGSREFKESFSQELATFFELTAFEILELRDYNVAPGHVMLRTTHGDFECYLASPGDFLSFYAFGLHKAGSSLLVGMLSAALERRGIPYVNTSDHAFEAGMQHDSLINPEDAYFRYGYGYIGFRGFPSYLKRFDLKHNKKIILIRDPRDMLVSYYFSMRYSHINPGGGVVSAEIKRLRSEATQIPIDQYCIEKSTTFLAEFASISHLLGTDVRLYRYENVIYMKSEWLSDMLNYLGIELPPAEIEDIAHLNDIRPERERLEQHIRQVAPGNYHKHLKAATINRLNEIFCHVLRKFGYAMG